MKFSYLLVSSLMASTNLSVFGLTSDFTLDEAGIRIGTDNEAKNNFMNYEIFGSFNTPWAKRLNEDFEMDLNLEFGAGVLDSAGATEVYLRAAPTLYLYTHALPFKFQLSVGPLLLSDDAFGDFRLGGHFYFASGVGLVWEVFDNWSLGYRFQHISNAHLDATNPGLDLHVFSFRGAF